MPAFLDRFVARVRALRVGDPLSPDTEVGPLINPGEVDRVESWAVRGSPGVRLRGRRHPFSMHDMTQEDARIPLSHVAEREIRREWAATLQGNDLPFSASDDGGECTGRSAVVAVVTVATSASGASATHVSRSV